MRQPDRSILLLRRRLFIGELLADSIAWLSAFLVTFGLIVLATKLFRPGLWPEVLWLGSLALPLLAAVARRAACRMPSERDTIALMDRRLNAGGLLMTLAERPDPTWSQRLPAADVRAAALPRIRPVRFAKAMAVPVLFAVGTGFVPAREVPQPASRITVGTDAAKQLAETFELLERVDAIDETSKESIKQELDRLVDEATDKPLTHEKWETVDALRERLRSGLETTELSVAQGRSAAAALAAAMNSNEPLTVERVEQLNNDLQKSLETLRKNGAFNGANGQAASKLPAELQQLLKDGGLQLPADADLRRETLAQLRTMLAGEQQRLAEARGQSQKHLGTQGDGSPFAPLAQGGIESQTPGRGGPGHGPGNAELTYGEESNDQAAKFKETVLPPGFLDKPNENALGVTASSPQIEPTAAEPRNAARGNDLATGEAAWSRPLRPRHREVVRGYFDGL